MFFGFSLAPLAFFTLVHVAPEPQPIASVVGSPGAADALPVPKEGFTIKVTKDARGRVDDSMNLAQLVLEFERVTGQYSLIAVEAAGVLEKVRCNITHDLQVAPQDVYFVFETMLVANDFAVTYLSLNEPRLFQIDSMSGNRRQQVRSSAHYVPESELASWVRHPATLITSVVELDATDVRTLSNSMRTMFTDANTQHIIPVGNSDSLIITGYASNVVALIDMLKATNEAARKSNAARAKAEAAAPKVEKEASKK